MRDRPHSGRDGVVDDKQVIVRIERHLVRIERPLGLTRRLNQFLGEYARRVPIAEADGADDAGGSNDEAIHKMAAREKQVIIFHMSKSPLWVSTVEGE